MAKRQKAAAAETPGSEPQAETIEQQADPATVGGAVPGDDVPAVGEHVFYWDRDAIVMAAERGIEPWPHAAIVTGAETYEGETGLLNVIQFHPSEGPIVRRHVRAGKEANCYTRAAAVVRVPMEHLIAAVQHVAALAGVNVLPQPPQDPPAAVTTDKPAEEVKTVAEA